MLARWRKHARATALRRAAHFLSLQPSAQAAMSRLRAILARNATTTMTGLRLHHHRGRQTGECAARSANKRRAAGSRNRRKNAAGAMILTCVVPMLSVMLGQWTARQIGMVTIPANVTSTSHNSSMPTILRSVMSTHRERPTSTRRKSSTITHQLQAFGKSCDDSSAAHWAHLASRFGIAFVAVRTDLPSMPVECALYTGTGMGPASPRRERPSRYLAIVPAPYKRAGSYSGSARTWRAL